MAKTHIKDICVICNIVDAELKTLSITTRLLVSRVPHAKVNFLLHWLEIFFSIYDFIILYKFFKNLHALMLRVCVKMKQCNTFDDNHYGWAEKSSGSSLAESERAKKSEQAKRLKKKYGRALAAHVCNTAASTLLRRSFRSYTPPPPFGLLVRGVCASMAVTDASVNSIQLNG